MTSQMAGAPQPAVVDTMIFAYALLDVSERREIALEVLRHASPLWVPDSLRAELGNVVWQWAMRRELPRHLAHAALDRADALVDDRSCASSVCDVEQAHVLRGGVARRGTAEELEVQLDTGVLPGRDCERFRSEGAEA